MMTPMIRVGDAVIWLDADALAADEVKLDRESISEQCDGCGRDILETGEVNRDSDVWVRCAFCKTCYRVVVTGVR